MNIFDKLFKKRSCEYCRGSCSENPIPLAFTWGKDRRSFLRIQMLPDRDYPAFWFTLWDNRKMKYRINEEVLIGYCPFCGRKLKKNLKKKRR